MTVKCDGGPVVERKVSKVTAMICQDVKFMGQILNWFNVNEKI